MAEAQRLSVWGWFMRAFAGGVGAMFGVMTALAFVCVAYYVLLAVCMTAFSSFGAVSIDQPLAIGGVTTSPFVESTPQATQFLPAQPVPAPYPTSAGYSSPFAPGVPATAAPSYAPAQPAFSQPQLIAEPLAPIQATFSEVGASAVPSEPAQPAFTQAEAIEAE